MSIYAHGHNISIRMLRICDSAGTTKIILNSCKNQSMFPDIWKKSKICSVHKKHDKQIINNYYQFVEKYLKEQFSILYISIQKITNYYQSIKLAFSQVIHVQTSFYQLYLQSFWCLPYFWWVTCSIFLDRSKAYLDNVWHKELIFKLMSVGVSDSLLGLIESSF